MEIVMPAYSVVCATFSITLASLQVINPSLVRSPDFIALPGCSHPPSFSYSTTKQRDACAQVKEAKTG